MRKRSEPEETESFHGGNPEPEAPSAAILSADDLDTAVKQVERLKMATAGSYWQLGRRIADIHEQQLWKLRVETNDKGKSLPRWKTWEAFCHHELKMSPKSANRAKDVALEFSEEEVQRWGHSKLDLLLQAPPQNREALQEAIESGATVREIEPQVRKVRDEGGFKRAPGGRPRKTQTPSDSPKPKPEKGRIVVAELLGTHTLKMYKRPHSFADSVKDDGSVDWAKHPRAKYLKDHPIALWRMLNDTVAFIEVTSSDGELVCKIQVAREEES